MSRNPSNHETEQLRSALTYANKQLKKRTRESNDYKNQLKNIKDNRLFLVYLAMNKTVSAPRRVAKAGKQVVYKVAKQTLRTDKTRRFAYRTAQKVRRFSPKRDGGKNTRLFVDALEATRSKQYQDWFKRHWPNNEALAQQREVSAGWTYRPLVSIIVPTYNTEIRFLKDAIESVQNQSYDNWELCFADDASKDERVREIITKYAQQDSRIKYVFRKKNGHISAASNSALKIATGEFVALLDHDDLLWPNALYEAVKVLNEDKKVDFLYSDEEKVSENGKRHEDPYFKPDWSPDQLRCHNYITHLAVIKRDLVSKVGGFREGYEGAQDWDLILRVSRKARKIHHIPTILYSWRKARTSTALRADAKGYAWTVQRHVLADDLAARGYTGKVRKTSLLGFWRIDYDIPTIPLVSIIIPTKDQYDLVKKCLESIEEYTTYSHYEVVIVDTGSTDDRIWQLYEDHAKNRVRVIKWTKSFNFSSVCNFGANAANGEYLVFLNNDTEVITVDWIERMLGLAQQDHVGAVGCRLLYPNRHIQHAGIVLGMGGFPDTPAIAGHVFAGWDNDLQDQYKIMFTDVVRNSSAVTAACLMVSAQKFNEVKGFDESFKIAFNDVDFCLKLGDKGYYNVFNPEVQLYHHESVSVGRIERNDRDLEAFKNEHRRMTKKWGDNIFANDPYFNKNYSLKNGYVEINPDAASN